MESRGNRPMKQGGFLVCELLGIITVKVGKKTPV